MKLIYKILKVVPIEEYKKLEGKYNTTRFENERLNQSIESLKKNLEEQAPLIKSLEQKIKEQQAFISRHFIEIMNDKQKMKEHLEIENKYSKKK